MFYYKVEIVDGSFVGVDYDDILEGIAYSKHVENGYGFVATNKEYNELEIISEDDFNRERG
jgi:hypothetical protein